MQKAFERDVKSLANIIEEKGNPFTEDSSGDLLALESRDIADPAVIDTLRQTEKNTTVPISKSVFNLGRTPPRKFKS